MQESSDKQFMHDKLFDYIPLHSEDIKQTYLVDLISCLTVCCSSMIV